MKVKVFFISIFLLFTIYQDCPLINVFGEIARTPIFLLSLPMLIYIFSFKDVMISKYMKYMVYYFMYLIAVAMIYLPAVMIYNQSFTILDQNILVKAIKTSIYFLLFMLYYQFVYTFFTREKNAFQKLFYALIFIQVFIAIFLVFEVSYQTSIEPFFPQIHASGEKYWRVRLLTYEESWTGSILVLVMFLPIFLAYYLDVSKKLKTTVSLISLFIFAYYTINSQSKGYLLLVLISILPLFISYVYKNEKVRKYLYFLAIFLVIGGVVVSLTLYDTIANKYTSGTFGTRFGSYLIGLDIFVHNPMGVSFGSYSYFYPKSAEKIIELSFLQDLNFNELSTYIRSTKFQSTKTFFFDHLIYGGLGFVYFCYFFFFKRFQFFSKNKFPFSFFVIVPYTFVILAGFIYISYDIKYEVWFLLAFLDVLENKINYEKTQ
jgi:hypothetical protein